MVGNTISRVCPYLNDWNLLNNIRNMKKGDIIDVKTGNKIKVNGKEIDVSIAIEFCNSIDGNKIAFGQASSMIDGGEWQTDKQPKLEYSKKLYDLQYRIGFRYMGFSFIAELLAKDNNFAWFIYPYNREFKDNIIIFSDEVKEKNNWYRDVYNIPLIPKLHDFLNKTFRQCNIFYSDDLTGTDFNKSIDFQIKK